ncbi:ribonuclease H-like domain-containing protein, partial [Tribonema minus]
MEWQPEASGMPQGLGHYDQHGASDYQHTHQEGGGFVQHSQWQYHTPDQETATAMPYVLDIPSDKVTMVDTPAALQWAGSVLRDSSIIALDTETQPNFTPRSPPHRTALLQIASRAADGTEAVFLIDLLALLPLCAEAMDSALYHCFRSEDILKVGHGLVQDVRELYMFYPQVAAFRRMNGVLEANAMHKQLDPEVVNMLSLKKLVLHYLNCSLSKGQQMSNWANRPLSSSQIHYAACDALVLLRLHDSMVLEIFEECPDFNIDDLLQDIDGPNPNAVECWQCGLILASAKAFKKVRCHHAF